MAELPELSEWVACGALPSYQLARRLDRSLASSSETGKSDLRIAVGGPANVDFMVPALRVQLASRGIAAEVEALPFDGWLTEAYAGTSFDVWVLWFSSYGASRGVTVRPEGLTNDLDVAMGRLRDLGSQLILVLPEPLEIEDDPFSPFVAWRREYRAAIEQLGGANVIPVSVDNLQWRLGRDRWRAARYWEMARMPAHPDALAAVGKLVGDVVARLRRPVAKAIAVDLDDTLWGGLVGEVGPDGLELDPFGAGRPYLEMQRYLSDLAAKGIALGAVSKNDPSQAVRPFRERREMILREDDFAFFEASWGAKHQALERFAATLNVGIDSICFVDDSPFERDQAKSMLADLIVPDLPADASKRVQALVDSGAFLVPQVTGEDLLRADFLKRQRLPTASEEDLDSYLSGLDMSLAVTWDDEMDMERAVQLLSKTNQFNVTGWRPTAREFAGFVASPRTRTFAVRLVDRLGDAGTIGVLSLEEDGDVIRLAGWVLSCRVFNRGVEWAMAEVVQQQVQERGYIEVVVPYRPTTRNGLIREVLASLGFVREDGASSELEIHRCSELHLPRHFVRIVDDA